MKLRPLESKFVSLSDSGYDDRLTTLSGLGLVSLHNISICRVSLSFGLLSLGLFLLAVVTSSSRGSSRCVVPGLSWWSVADHRPPRQT